MWKNYFKIAFRNLRKNSVFSIVNILGIALSISAFVLMLEYISFEQGVNQNHLNANHIVRVNTVSQDNNSVNDFTPPPFAPQFKQNFSEIQAYCRIMDAGTATGIVATTKPDNTLQSFRQKNITYTDASYFRIFTQAIISGNAQLDAPNQVVISESEAQKLFANTNSIGKTITLYNQFGKTNYEVTAVCQNAPEGSDLNYGYFFSLKTLENPANLNGNDWANLSNLGFYSFHSFLLLAPTANRLALTDKANTLLHKNFPQANAQIQLQDFEYLHLGKSLGDTAPTSGNLKFIYLLGCIGILILLISWLNYINLSTASAIKRGKEVGIRKVVGASRPQLVAQFLGESLLLNIGGVIFSVLIIALTQDYFNDLVQKNLSFSTIFENKLWGISMSVILMGLVVSGGYVAMVLSSFSTTETLKGTFSKSVKGIFLRKTLVVFQFTVSVSLIIATLVLYRQLMYMQNQNLGMNIDQLLVIKGPQITDSPNRKQSSIAFKQALAGLPFVKSYSMSGSVPGNSFNFSIEGFTKPNPQTGDEKKVYQVMSADNQYFAIYQIPLLAGNNFTDAMCEQGYEGDKLIINQQAAESLGFVSPQAAIGQKVNWGKTFEIIGVISNYHHFSLKQAIEPTVIVPQFNQSYYTVRLTTKDIGQKMTQLEQTFKKSFVGNPFEYFFADDNFDQQYHTEQQYGRLFITCSSLAIFISCLGLFGLALFNVEQKTKEIGIRKVLGASISQIVMLLSKDFLQLVFIALCIASPLAWWAGNIWLTDFAYRIELSWWIFVLAGLVAIAIALITISFQAIRAATANPIQSLRSE